MHKGTGEGGRARESCLLGWWPATIVGGKKFRRRQQQRGGAARRQCSTHHAAAHERTLVGRVGLEARKLDATAFHRHGHRVRAVALELEGRRPAEAGLHRLVAAVAAAVVHASGDRVRDGLHVPAGQDTVGAAGQVFEQRVGD